MKLSDISISNYNFNCSLKWNKDALGDEDSEPNGIKGSCGISEYDGKNYICRYACNIETLNRDDNAYVPTCNNFRL